MMKKLTYYLIALLSITSCNTPKNVIDDLSSKTNTRYNSTFFDRAIENSNIQFSKNDTVYVLEHFYDIISTHDMGIIWNTKNEFTCYQLVSTRYSEKGSPYRFYSYMDFFQPNEKSKKFSLEIELVNAWDIDKIKELASLHQTLGGTFFAIRIYKKNGKWKGDYMSFNDLRDY